MDVPSMIKVNELAKELVKKGVAPSSEEASKMAADLLQKDLPEGSKKTDDYDKYEILLERIQRKFDSDVGSLKEQLTSVVNELGFLKNDIKKIKLAKEEPRAVEEVKKPQAEEKQSVLDAKKDEKSDSNQRTGELKPGDISIEDYFYCGEKKK